MRAISRRLNRDNIILSCEEDINFLFFKKTVKSEYIATEEFPKGYWNWRKLPDKTLISSHLSFQLDSWNKDFMEEEKRMKTDFGLGLYNWSDDPNIKDYIIDDKK